MNPSDPKSSLLKLLASQQLAVLATQSKNIPYANLIAFSPTTTNREILFATLRNTTKYQNLSTNKKVSLLFDNRKNNVSDFSQAITATAIGTVHEVDKQQYQDLFLAKHPHLEDFVKNIDCALMMIIVDKYIVVEQFQEKTSFTP
jgi:general stress protein 26